MENLIIIISGTMAEKIPNFFARMIMYLGFNVIIILGMLNRLCFNPKLAGRNYKKVSFITQLHRVFSGNVFTEIYRNLKVCSTRSMNCTSITFIDVQVTAVTFLFLAVQALMF